MPFNSPEKTASVTRFLNVSAHSFLKRMECPYLSVRQPSQVNYAACHFTNLYAQH